MKNGLKKNKENLLFLNAETMNAIFDCVYGVDDHLQPKTKALLKDEYFQCYLEMLIAVQQFKYRYQSDDFIVIYPLFDRTVGPMQTNSDGTLTWLAMGMAIRDIYGMSNSRLESLMKLVKIRK